MKTYYQEGRLQRLELKIREILADKVYGGKHHEVDNLYSRLDNFFIEPPFIQLPIRRGIEGLRKQGLEPDNIEDVARSIYDEYRSRAGEGIGEIYHPRSHFFMKSEVRNIRNWTVRYAALLDMVDRGNRFATNVSKFDAQIRALLMIYHNLFAHQTTFLRDKEYETSIGTLKEINQNREDLGRIESDDPVMKKLVDEVKKHSYITSAAILSAFVYHARQNGTRLTRSQISSLELERRVLARRLKELDLLSQLGSKEFYQEKTVPALIEEKR